MKNFSIYRASAGSGKTYLLTYTYLKLALEQPDNFKSILAVTFTNKAMQEMKSRIVETLQKLRNGAHPMSDDLKNDLSINATELQSRADSLLTRILHNYSFFSVSTIDTFFQKVVRSFGRELGIHSGFKIEMDHSKVLSEVIGQLILKMEEDPALVQWLTQFAIHEINQGKNWDTQRQIKKLSFELFNEQVVLHKEDIFKKMEKPDFMPDFIQKVFEKKLDFEKKISELGKIALQIIESHGLTREDFTQKKRGVGGYVEKIVNREIPAPNSYVMAAVEEGKWANPKSDNYGLVETALAAGLDFAVSNVVSFYQDNIQMYNTISQVANYLYTFGLLSQVERSLQEYKKENEVLLISDFPLFLNEIINDSESPFVYEKIGNRYRHYLIDEFQDTSAMQWDNFKPLIKDSISQGDLNMVVGDIKQSIYRWRGGNWKILLDGVKQDIGQEYTKEESLVTNRRSKQNIIDFNNQFFTKAPEILETSLLAKIDKSSDELKIKKAYNDAHQNAYDQSQTGLVEIAFFDTKEEDYSEDLILKKLIHDIQNLQNHNYKLSDITILVRKKQEGRRITQALLEYQSQHPDDSYKYDIISNESLFLRKNSAVHLLLQCLFLAENPTEPLHVEQLKYASAGHFEADLEQSKIDEFVRLVRESKSHTLTSLVELSLIHFDLFSNQKDVPYIMAFQDVIMEYLQYEPDSLSNFRMWWEEEKGRSIQISGDQDAMNLMTIHKSKGLQFKAVLIPFCHWGMDHASGFREQMIWCETKGIKPIDEVSMLPLRYTSALKDTVFYNEYFEEKSDAYLDSLNLLYVAMTRAEEVLLITSEYALKREPGINTVGALLFEFSNQENLALSEEGIQQKLTVGAMGSFSQYHEEEILSLEIKAKASLISGHERLKFRSSNGILEEDQQHSIDYGEIVHWIFSKIVVKNDFHVALDQAVLKFSLSENELVEIKQLLREVWELPQVSAWFSERWIVKNEVSILLENGKVKRPDRVVFDGQSALVIDYKTGKESAAHLKQVEGYKQLLKQMGYVRVSGYLLYLSTQNVVTV